MNFSLVLCICTASRSSVRLNFIVSCGVGFDLSHLLKVRTLFNLCLTSALNHLDDSVEGILTFGMNLLQLSRIAVLMTRVWGT